MAQPSRAYMDYEFGPEKLLGGKNEIDFDHNNDNN